MQLPGNPKKRCFGESLTGEGGQEFAGRLAGALGPWRLIAGIEK